MLNYKFIRVNAFILIILLLFSVSAYDPSVYAKMQVMEDDNLAQIEGETGVTLGLNLTVRSAAYNISIGNGTDAGLNDAINFGVVGSAVNSFFIGDNTQGGNFTVSANVLMEVGSNSGRTLLSMSGLSLPSSAAGIGVIINNLNVNADSVNRTFGNIALTGIFMGRDVTAVSGAITPTLTSTSPMSMQIGAHSGSGIDLYSSTSMYIDNIKWVVSTGTNPFSVNGIYMYGTSSEVASGNVALWTTSRTGNMTIGGDIAAGNYATVDVGSNGSTNGTILRLSIPNSGSIRIKDFTIGANDFGPIVLDNQIFNRLLITVRHLNASGY